MVTLTRVAMTADEIINAKVATKPLPEVSAKFGAPMGRLPDNGAEYSMAIAVEPIMDDENEGYDYGGAYWGCGQGVYRVMNSKGQTLDYIVTASYQGLKEHLDYLLDLHDVKGAVVCLIPQLKRSEVTA